MNKGNIVIVEDELIIDEDLSMTLKEKGYEVIAAVLSIEEATAIYHERRPDLILMNFDLHTTQLMLSGARLIREEFTVPVIFLTTRCGDALSGLENPSPCVRKPFSEKELCAVIEIVLNEHRRNSR
jgi:DNA-binding response OmpR family regulator